MSRASRRRLRRSKIERLHQRRDVPGLVALLARHDWLVRRGEAIDLEVPRRVEAVTALGSIPGNDAEAGVVRALDDGDPRVLLAAVDSLRPAPGIAAAKALARATASWRDPSLEGPRAAALELMLELGDELLAVEYATALLEDERESSLSREEETAIRELFANDSGPVAERFARQLAHEIGAPDEPEHRRASQTLVAMGSVAVGPLVMALSDPGRRIPAATALGALRATSAVPALVGLLSDADAASRAAAARALGAIRDPGAIEGLVRASSDVDADVRDAALDGLDRMRGLLLAVLGAAAFQADEARGRLDRELSRTDVPRLPAGAFEHRSLLQRLLGRDL